MAKINIDSLLTRLKAYPAIPASDNSVYAIANGKFEEICKPGYDVVIQDQASATTLEGDGTFQVPMSRERLQQLLESGVNVPQEIVDMVMRQSEEVAELPMLPSDDTKIMDVEPLNTDEL